MIRCIRLFSLAPHRVHHIARHVHCAHRAYRAHIVSRVACYAVAGAMALGAGAMLAHPPFVHGWEGVAPTVAPAPTPNLLPPSAFVAPGPIWPAVIEAPIQYPPRECVPGTRESTEAWCRHQHHHHHHPVPEPAGLAVLGVALAGLAIGRRA